MRRLSLPHVAALLLASRLAGQAVHEEVTVQVTAMSGASIYVDKGRVDGLEPGDPVTLFPRGKPPVLARVVAVSRSNARLELLGALVPLVPGTSGKVEVPRARLQKAGSGGTTNDQSSAPPTRKVPEHPPWQQPLQGDDRKGPLLAPVAGRTPAERPVRIRGRVWLHSTLSQNRELVDQQFMLSSLGTELTVSNPLGAGGELLLRGDVSHRQVAIDGQTDEDTTRGRLDRLSYRLGHADDARHRFQVGRFLQTAFPELGLVDGVEVDTRLAGEHRLGLSVGGYPEPFAAQATGDDVQTALFWRYASGALHELDVGVALQKTWHRGAPDRDLLLLNLHARPTADLSLYGAAWVDYYTGSERVQSSGLELTQLLLNGSWRLAAGHGVGLGVSHLRWPDLLRNEAPPLAPAALLDDRVFRATVNSWHDLAPRVRASSLLTYWEDQDRDGVAGEVGVAFRDMLFDHGRVEVQGFRTEGAFQTGYGARLRASYFAGRVSWSGGYELARIEDDTPALRGSSYTQHALTGGLQMVLTRSTDFSFHIDYRFGDAQDALTLGAFIQTRF